MTEVERLNTKLSLIRLKLKKNKKVLSGKNTTSKIKVLNREKTKLEKLEQKVLTDIQRAVVKSERDQKREVKSLKNENQNLERKNESLQRQVPMVAEEADDFDIED